MKQAIIIASGLADLVGHEFEYTAAVAKALRHRGYSVSILGARDAVPEVAALEGFVPVFRRTARPLGTKAPPWEFFRLVGIFLADLHKAVSSLRLEKEDLVFAHTITYPNFVGWVWSWLWSGKALPKTILLFRYSLMLRNPSRFRVLRQLLLPQAYRVLFWLLQRSSRPPVIVVDSEDLREEYRFYTSLPIKVVPIPLDVNGLDGMHSAMAVQSCGRLDRRLLYLGDVRGGKGFELLPPLVEALKTNNASDLSITIHCGRPPERYIEPGLARAFIRLQEFSKNGAVELIPSSLTRTDYLSLLANADIVLLPYRREYYAGQTSNVLAEAFAAGKPVVVPKDTWMASQVLATGAGAIFESGSADSLVHATREILENLFTYANAARRLRGHWSAYHNVERLADELEHA